MHRIKLVHEDLRLTHWASRVQDQILQLANLPTELQLVTVTVPGGGGDFNSIEAANNSITDASASKPYGLVVYPGVFEENPIILKPYIALTALSRGSAVIRAINNNSPLLTFTSFSTVKDLIFQGPTADASIYVPAGQFNCQIENLQFNSGQIAVLVSGINASLIVEECKAFNSVGDTVVCENGARVDCSNVLTLCNGAAFKSDGGTIWIHNSGCIGSEDGVYALNGGTIYPHSFTAEACQDVIHTGPGINNIQGDAVTGRNTFVYDLHQESAGSTVNISSADINISKVLVADWDDINMDYSGQEDGANIHVFTEELSVGVPEKGYASHLGQGASYTRGMMVLTTDDTAGPLSDGSNFIDVSLDARSEFGTFTFQGVAVNHTILIGSSLSDTLDSLKHFGLTISQSTAAQEILKRSFVIEIWDGVNWSEVYTMAVSQVEQYRYANEIFIRANSKEIIHYGIQNDTIWNKKTINGMNLYWSRIRIVNTITVAPVFEQFRLITSHTHINVNGNDSKFGFARFKLSVGQGGNAWGDSGVGNALIPVGLGGVPSSWSQILINSGFNSNGDSLTFQFPLPPGIDTSIPLILESEWVPFQGTAGSVALIGSVLPSEVAGVLEADPAGGIIPVPRTLAQTESLISKPAQVDSRTLISGVTDKLQRIVFGPFNISNYYEGDIIALRLEMDNEGIGLANCAIWNLAIITGTWTLGRSI